MKTFRGKIFLILALLCAAFFLGACKSNDETENARRRSAQGTKRTAESPWARPQNWEGGLPGMTSGGMPNQY